MKYAYEDLSSEQFEDLVIFICQPLLGIAVQGFATGPDGGRDAKFIGTANIFPSTASPWSGTTIIQAKHTNGYNKNFADSDFFSKESNSNVIAKEIPRIKKLRISKELDHYMFFANRRLTANTQHEIQKYLSTVCDIPVGSIYLCGIEQIEVWIKTFPSITQIANIDPIDSPLIVSPDDLAEVVQALAKNKDSFDDVPDDPPSPRVSYERKNELNDMSPEYAKHQRKQYLKETSTIQNFLSMPGNNTVLQQYESVVDEFQLKIIAKRKNYQSFDEIMNYLLDLLFKRDVILSRNKRLTRAMLFYMYWNCDIGKTDDA